MIPRVDQACGLGVHKSTVSGTVLYHDSTAATRSFPSTIDGLLRLRDWIQEHHCQRVLMEATGRSGPGAGRWVSVLREYLQE